MKIQLRNLILEMSTRLKKEKVLKNAGIIFTNTRNHTVRNLKNSRGDILSGKELRDAKEKMGLPSNNDIQGIIKFIKNVGGHRELMIGKNNGKHDLNNIIVGHDNGVPGFYEKGKIKTLSQAHNYDTKENEIPKNTQKYYTGKNLKDINTFKDEIPKNIYDSFTHTHPISNKRNLNKWGKNFLTEPSGWDNSKNQIGSSFGNDSGTFRNNVKNVGDSKIYNIFGPNEVSATKVRKVGDGPNRFDDNIKTSTIIFNTNNK